MDSAICGKEEGDVFGGVLDEGEEMCCSGETRGRICYTIDRVGWIW